MDIKPGYTETISTTLSADTGFGGSFTIPYPAGKDQSHYKGVTRSYLRGPSMDLLYQSRGHFTTAYGASGVTVTILTAKSFPLGDVVYLELDMSAPGKGGVTIPHIELADNLSMDSMQLVKISLGTPAGSDSDGAVASQSATAAGGLATGINGALASGGVATFDVPRNVVAAWTNTAVLTVTGTDAYGKVLVESSASGTSMTGKKAFKTITGVSVSADVTGLTVGNSKVLGLPVFLTEIGDVLAELEDGAAATAGTVLPGVVDAATATTGDIRGTYAPNSNPDGTTVFELTVALRDPSYKGGDQYAG